MLLLAAAVDAAPARTVRWFASADGACTWNEAPLPYGPPRVLVRWATPCAEEPLVAVAGGRVLVRTDANVTLLNETGSTVTATLLGAPPVGSIGIVGFDAAGAEWALTLGRDEPTGGAFLFEGRSYSYAHVTDGMPALAHAYRWSGASWVHTEAVVTTTGWDYAQEASALPAFGTLVGPIGGAFRSFLYADWLGVGEPIELDADRSKLETIAPHPPDMGEWNGRRVGAVRVAWWAEAAEFLTPSLPVLIDRGAGWTVAIPAGRPTNGIRWSRLACDGTWLLARVDFEPAAVRALAGGAWAKLPKGSTAPMFWPLP